MVTCVDDLLTALGQETTGQNSHDPGDAARALHFTSRTLNRIRADGIGRHAPQVCDDTIRRLADSCDYAATAFEQQPGRVSDLTGATADGVATLHHDLSDAARLVVAARLAPIARRCAAAIMASGPYSQVPELLAVADRARELQRAVAVAIPSELSRMHGLDAPIPTTLRYARLSPAAAVLESTAVLVAELRRRDRERLTLRELVAVCHVASRVAEGLVGEEWSGEGKPSDGLPATWRTARDTLTLYSDGIPLPPPTAGRSIALRKAVSVEAAARRASLGVPTAVKPAPDCSPDVPRKGARQLQLLANACEAELTKIAHTLVVTPGARPISERRTAEWLRTQPFPVEPDDLRRGLSALRHAAAEAQAIPSRDPGRRAFSWRLPAPLSI